MKLFLIAFLFTISTAFGQQTINDLTVKKFTVVNTKLGSKPCPLMSESQRDAIAIPESGDCIYNTTSLKLNTYDGSDWKAAGGGGIDAWVPAFDYKAGNLVVHNKKIYSALIDHTSTIFSTDLAGGKLEEVSQGVTDHTQLTNIGTNTHPQIDSHIANNANPHAVTKAQVGLSAVPNIDTSTTQNISDYLNKRFVLDSDLILISTIAGKQSSSTLTTKGDIYVATAASTVTRHGAGANGEIVVYDSTSPRGIVNQKPGYIDTESMIQFTGIEDISGNWISGNNATFYGGVSSLGGTFAKDCTSASISQKCTYVYTQAAGSLNDWIASGLLNVPSKYRAPNTVYLTFNYSYDGANGDIVPVLYSAVGSVVIEGVAPIKPMVGTNGAVYKAVYAVNLSPTQSTMILGFHTKALNSGKIFKYNDLKITTSLSELGIVSNYNIQSERVVNNATTVSGTSGNIRFSTTRISNGFGNVVTSDNGTNTVFTALKTIHINFCAKALIGTSGNGFSINLNGTAVSASNTTASGGTDYQQSCANLILNGGDYLTVSSAASLRLAVADYNFTSIAIENPQVSSSNQITSSDSLPLVQKTTQVISTDPIGTYTTFTHPASGSISSTVCATAPTQSNSSMNTNGIQLFATNYSTANTCASPSAIEIVVGQKLNGKEVYGYFGTGKTTPLVVGQTTISTSTITGLMVVYNQTTGILRLEAGDNHGSGVTSRIFYDVAMTSRTSGYFSFAMSTQPTISVIPNASLCTSDECQDNYSWFISAAGAITSTNKPGSITCTGTTMATCTYSASLASKLTIPMICTIGPGSWGAEFTTNTTTGFQVNRFNTTNGAGTAYPTNVSCTKAWPDSKGAQYKVIGITDVVAHYYMGANQAVTGNTTPINFNVKVRDDFNIVTTVSGGLRATIPAGKSGRYSINATASGTTNTAHSLQLYKNGVSLKEGPYGGYVQAFVYELDLMAGDYIDLRDTQTHTLSGNQSSSVFQMKRVEAF